MYGQHVRAGVLPGQRDICLRVLAYVSRQLPLEQLLVPGLRRLWVWSQQPVFVVVVVYGAVVFELRVQSVFRVVVRSTVAFQAAVVLGLVVCGRRMRGAPSGEGALECAAVVLSHERVDAFAVVYPVGFGDVLYVVKAALMGWHPLDGRAIGTVGQAVPVES